VSRTATEANVIAALGSSPATAFYSQLTLLSALGGFSFGCGTSSTSPAFNFVPTPRNGCAQRHPVATAVGAIAVDPPSRPSSNPAIPHGRLGRHDT
jgi:hypothetical protein